MIACVFLNCEIFFGGTVWNLLKITKYLVIVAGVDKSGHYISLTIKFFLEINY